MKNKSKKKIVNLKSRFLRTNQKESETKKQFKSRLDKSFYKKSVKFLRKNQLTALKFDLRKSLTPQEKSLITRCIKEYSKYDMSSFTRIYKTKGETDKQYYNRCKKIKNKWGQSKSLLKGVFINYSQDLHATPKIDKNGNIKIPKFIPNINSPHETTKEIWIPIDKIKFISNPYYYVKELVDEYKPTIIIPVFGNGQGVGQYVASDTNKNLKMFITELNKIKTKYQQVELTDEFLNGFILRTHYIWGDKLNYG